MSEKLDDFKSDEVDTKILEIMKQRELNENESNFLMDSDKRRSHERFLEISLRYTPQIILSITLLVKMIIG